MTWRCVAAAALSAGAFLSPTPARAQVATEDAADVRSMEQLLATLASDARDRRVLGLSLGLGGGALAVGAGAWFMADDPGTRVGDGPGVYVIAAGAALMAGGVMNAVLPTFEGGLRIAWQETAHLPMEARRANITRFLDEAGEHARTQRRAAGGGLIAVGAASVITAGLFYAFARESRGAGSMEFALCVGGVGLMAAGIPTLANRSPIENAALFWRAGVSRPPPRFAGASVLPVRGGVLVGVGLSL